MAEIYVDSAPRLAGRLAAAQRRRFVGRNAELELFRSALQTDDPPFAVLHVHGPGGVGKSALLREYARLALEERLPVAVLDARSVDPSPLGFTLALRGALGLADDVEPLAWLGGQPRLVLLLDTYELMAPLDAWLRQRFFPQLPSRSLVVAAGRTPPDPAWTSDLGWGELVRAISLRNLRPEETRAYLAERRIPAERHESVLEFTHGHPLALSLVADALGRSDAAAFRADQAPDVVRLLLERFLDDVPSPTHRLALYLCAHARCTSEPLLAEVVGDGDAHELFEWLRAQTFIEEGSEGLFPHDLAREVLNADFRWRNPDSYCDMHVRAERYARRRVRETSGRSQQRAVFDKLYMSRASAIARPYLHWPSLGVAYAEVATERDHATILEMTRRHEGDASARLVEYWLGRQPEGFLVVRVVDDAPVGFVARLVLRESNAEDAAIDPAVRAAWNFVRRHGPVRAGEEILYHRFFVGRDNYQGLSPTTNVAGMVISIEGLTRPRLAWSLLALADTDWWAPMMSYLAYERAPDASFVVGGREYGVYAHDWRVEPGELWGERLSERGVAESVSPVPDRARAAPLHVLSEPEFDAAIRDALRDYARPRALATNPLLRSRLVVERSGGEPSVAALQALVLEAVESLRAPPRDEKFYRALLYTYLEPASTQERAAERLRLPFTTYRYQLVRGTERVVKWLWERELYGAREDFAKDS